MPTEDKARIEKNRAIARVVLFEQGKEVGCFPVGHPRLHVSTEEVSFTWSAGDPDFDTIQVIYADGGSTDPLLLFPNGPFVPVPGVVTSLRRRGSFAEEKKANRIKVQTFSWRRYTLWLPRVDKWQSMWGQRTLEICWLRWGVRVQLPQRLEIRKG